MVKAITHWDSLLLGHPFVVETDHKNLCFLYKSDNPKVVRWGTRLSEYSFEVHHIAGIDNPLAVADALSRVHPVQVSAASSVSALQVAGASKRVPGSTVERPAVLVSSVVETIQYVHSEAAGHRGVKATVDKLLRAGYNRSNLQQEVEYVIANCGICQKIANRRQDDDKSQPRFTGIMEVGEEWSLDTIGPLPADESGNTYIMVAICGFSRFVVLEPASDASGESVARFLLKLVGWFGRPKGIRMRAVWVVPSLKLLPPPPPGPKKGIRTDGGPSVDQDHSTTIISSKCSVIYWALIDTLLWPIGHRRTAKLGESTRKSVGIFGSSAWIDGSRTSGAACCLLFSGLSTPSYTRFWVWSQLESSLVGYKLWTDFSYQIPYLVQCIFGKHLYRLSYP